MKNLKRSQWRQIGGDVNPSQYGAIIARIVSEAVQVLEIQPVRAHSSDRAALVVGFPFWSRKATYTLAELNNPHNTTLHEALRSCGFNPRGDGLGGQNDLPAEGDSRYFALAEICLGYGYNVNEGPSGWAKDVLGDTRVVWWTSRYPKGYRYIQDEDVEFRALQRGRGRR
jgi:hypothetical protein